MGLIMYILMTLEFPKHNLDFHLVTSECYLKQFYYKHETLSSDTNQINMFID